MPDQPQVEALGAHRYLVRALAGEDMVEVEVHANPAVVARITGEPTDEARVVEATAAYLIARQRADDLPQELDLEDVIAAYDGFEEELRRDLAGDRAGRSGAGGCRLG